MSGGSLTLSGFFIPAFMAKYKTGAMLNCGALRPQVAFNDPAGALSASAIHFQSTQGELSTLQPEYPPAIQAYGQAAQDAGLSAGQINALMTVDNSPQGGHW